MSYKRVLSNITFGVLFVAYASVAFADRVVLDSSTIFGRIEEVTSSSVKIATGCSGQSTKTILWNSINEFGGIAFDSSDCNANYHQGHAGATAKNGPIARLFAITFKNHSSVWATDISLDNTKRLTITLAKGSGIIHGPVSDVSGITWTTVSLNNVIPASFKWPASFTH